MNEGSEFQTDGAEHRKARFLVNGTVSSKMSDYYYKIIITKVYF